jgi:hypothetical protein
MRVHLRRPATGSLEEGQAMMMNKQNVVAALRRDVTFVGNAVVTVMFVGFAGLAIAAALFDLISLHR